MDTIQKKRIVKNKMVQKAGFEPARDLIIPLV